MCVVCNIPYNTYMYIYWYTNEYIIEYLGAQDVIFLFFLLLHHFIHISLAIATLIQKFIL